MVRKTKLTKNAYYDLDLGIIKIILALW